MNLKSKQVLALHTNWLPSSLHSKTATLSFLRARKNSKLNDIRTSAHLLCSMTIINVPKRIFCQLRTIQARMIDVNCQLHCNISYQISDDRPASWYETRTRLILSFKIILVCSELEFVNPSYDYLWWYLFDTFLWNFIRHFCVHEMSKSSPSQSLAPLVGRLCPLFSSFFVVFVEDKVNRTTTLTTRDIQRNTTKLSTRPVLSLE